jgi:MFS transporter, ACS family, glucarate transporter
VLRMKYQHRVVGMLSLLAIITYLDRVCMAVAGPQMQDSLGIGPKAWGWVISVFFFSYAAFEIPTGALGDRIGPRRVLTRVVMWWSAFTSLTGVVSSYSLLLLTRFCFGMGEAGAYPNASIVIGRWIPQRKRAIVWGIVWMTSQLGAAIAPLLVVPIQLHYGWRVSFYVLGVLGVVWSVFWYAWFRDSPREMPGVTGAEHREIGEDPPPRHGGMPWGLALRSGALWRIASLVFCFAYVNAFFQSWLQTYLVKGRGFTAAALVYSTLPYIVGACANVSGGIASDTLTRKFGLKTGRRAVGMLGLGTAAIFVFASILATSGIASLTFLSLAYAGLLFQQPNLCAVYLDVGRTRPGAIFGFMNTAINASASISSVVFGYLVAYSGGYELPFIPMLILLCAGTVLWVTVDPTRELFTEQQPEAEEHSKLANGGAH